MIADKTFPALAGIAFIGIGFRLRQKQSKKWRVFSFSGVVLLLLVVLALVFGLSM
jgi:hypothetical protein